MILAYGTARLYWSVQGFGVLAIGMGLSAITVPIKSVLIMPEPTLRSFRLAGINGEDQ